MTIVQCERKWSLNDATSQECFALTSLYRAQMEEEDMDLSVQCAVVGKERCREGCSRPLPRQKRGAGQRLQGSRRARRDHPASAVRCMAHRWSFRHDTERTRPWDFRLARLYLSQGAAVSGAERPNEEELRVWSRDRL